MLLEACDIVKRFPGVTALDDVTLRVEAGRIISVVGENGAGKSTLMKIIAGDETPDRGRILIDGSMVDFREPRDAMAAGIVLIHQELSLADNLDVGANILLGREPRRGPFLDHRAGRQAARKALATVGLGDLDPGCPISGLGMGTRQLVEIAKAMATDASVVVMDEPTSSLSEGETLTLLETVERLRDRGTAIVYISHRLEEVCRISDRVEVLRDGRHVGTLEGEAIERGSMVRLMVGRDLVVPGRRSEGRPSSEGPPRLRVAGLRTRRFPDEVIDLEVRGGEIVALAGLVGAGRTELLRGLVGVDRVLSGRLEIDGRAVSIRNPADAAAAGLALVPEDRKDDGLFLDETIADNLVMVDLARRAHGGVFRSRSRERLLAGSLVSRLGVRPSRPELAARGLSGGNQQKVALGRWVAREPRILLLDEPTRGVDVGAKAEVHSLLAGLAGAGAAIVMASGEMEEILAVADRVLVFHDGRIAGELLRREATEAAIMELATGTDRLVSGTPDEEAAA